MPFRDGEVDLVACKYICAQCYGDLFKQEAPDRRWRLVCHNGHDVEITGRITRKWAEHLGQKLAGRRLDIEVEIDREKTNRRPAELIIKELGF